jgi:predicted AlkP superfamily pyrophosphatase or phosphodiesterase
MRNLKLLLVVVTTLLAVFLYIATQSRDIHAQQVATPATSKAVASRILIVSIDGLRPDLALRADMPNLRGLLPQSSYSFWARTVPHAITLPSHTSMLTGVVPRKHEVEWNRDLPLTEQVYPKFPTLFEVAKRAGYTTGMAAGKSKFATLAKPGSLDCQFITQTEKAEDADVTAEAVKIITQHKPQVMFVHLPTIDNVGHKIGWGTKEQMAAIKGADESLGKLLAALQTAGVRQETVILITADHGGAGKTHLADDMRARHIPWILSGPGIRKDLDLTIYPKTVIDTEDTFVTASYLLGIPRQADLDGKPILEVLEQPVELLGAK